jgi:hypothetical protein
MNSDRDFVDNLNGSLTRSLSDIDDNVLEKLAYSRARALSISKSRKKHKVVFAVAASIFFVALFPGASFFHHLKNSALESSYLKEDPQFLSDMDVLIAMEVGAIEQ